MQTQTDYLLTLAYLMGERTVQSSTTASRGQFIQATLGEIYRAYEWPFATVRTSITNASGIASLASNFDKEHDIEAYFYQGTEQVPMDYINEIDQTKYQLGDNKFWIESQTDGTFLLKTKNSDTPIYVKYQAKPPEVNASVSSPFDDKMTIALGARRYIKLSQDPNADISQDEALFQKRLNENIASTQVGNPRRKLRILGNANGYRVGGGYQ